MKEYKRLTGADDYDCEIDFCWRCQYFGETHVCENPSGECSNYTRFCEMYCRLAELEDKIENGTLAELPCIAMIEQNMKKNTVTVEKIDLKYRLSIWRDRG